MRRIGTKLVGVGRWLAIGVVVLLAASAAAQTGRTVPSRPPDELTAAAERKLDQLGIRRIDGRHLTLYTDLPADEAIDSLPALFDQAVGPWCEYFDVKPRRVESWRVRGCLMKDREKFREAGLTPKSNPDFRNGYSTAYRLWVMDQPTAYYRRHLLLHEGTHAFMYETLGGCGPGWHMEGMAETLATHRLAEGHLQLGVMPRRREEVPMLGRIKLVQDAVKANGVKPISAVLQIDNSRPLENDAYAWSWALVKFLDTHPRYRGRFRSLREQAPERDFTERFRRLFADDWLDLTDEWRLFAGTLTHGHDIERTAVAFGAGTPLDRRAVTLRLRSDRSWQSSGVRLAAGKTYRIEAKGRFQIARTTKVWWCEPGGVTIRYYAGAPLGVLQAAVRPVWRERSGIGGQTSEVGGRRPEVGGQESGVGGQGAQDSAGAEVPGQGRAEGGAERAGEDWILRPVTIGLGATITPEYDGTLYLRVNDSPAELGDNVGEMVVTIRSD